MTTSPTELMNRISQARSGCVNTLGELLELYRSYLTTIAHVQIDRHYQTKFSSSDIVQGTFLRARKFFSQFNGSTEAELLSWLRRILASELVQQIRCYSTLKRNVGMEQRIHSGVNETSIVLAGLISARDKSPSQSALRRERAVLLADALNKLPDNYREVLTLKHLRHLGFDEVASQTGRSLDSVKGLWRRAVARLRDELGDGIL